MKLYRTFAAILAASVLCACSPVGDGRAEDTSPALQTTAETTTAAPEPEITVSPLAAEEYLTPLEDFSWEREFDAEFVMIHFTSAVTLSRDDPYNMSSIREIFEDGGISIHYIIDRDGTVRCYIPEDRAAWHAGKGEFAGDEKYTDKMNKYAIGIELAAIGSQADMAQYLTPQEYAALDQSLVGFTEAQYSALAALVADICERNGIPLDREHVIGHEEYSPSKSDPGELFDWGRIIK